jgi:hypothetical protein
MRLEWKIFGCVFGSLRRPISTPPNNSLNPTANSATFIRELEGLIQSFRGRVNSGVRFLLNGEDQRLKSSCLNLERLSRN